jgi:hypothetical protein
MEPGSVRLLRSGSEHGSARMGEGTDMRIGIHWSRIIMATIAALIVALGCSMALTTPKASALGINPSQACPAIYPRPASCDAPTQEALAPTNHVGWTHLNLNHCAAQVCTAQYRADAPAFIPRYTWSGAQWYISSFSETKIKGGWVYVSPYSGQWRWAYTQTTGWVIATGRFELR